MNLISIRIIEKAPSGRETSENHALFEDDDDDEDDFRHVMFLAPMVAFTAFTESQGYLGPYWSKKEARWSETLQG